MFETPDQLPTMQFLHTLGHFAPHTKMLPNGNTPQLIAILMPPQISRNTYEISYINENSPNSLSAGRQPEMLASPLKNLFHAPQSKITHMIRFSPQIIHRVFHTLCTDLPTVLKLLARYVLMGSDFSPLLYGTGKLLILLTFYIC